MRLLIYEKCSAVQSTSFEHMSCDIAFIVALFSVATMFNVFMLMTGFSNTLPMLSTLYTRAILTTCDHGISWSREP